MFKLRVECSLGERVIFELRGENVYTLKKEASKVLDILLESCGLNSCFVDLIIEKDGDYYDSDSDMLYTTEEGLQDFSLDNERKVARFEKVSLKHWVLSVTEEEFNKESCEEIYDWYNSIVLPQRKTSGSAGYDFIAYRDIVIPPYTTVMFYTGIKCQIDGGYVLELYPRSSLGIKYSLTLDNTVSIIDSDFYNNEENEGNIKVSMTNHSDKEIVIKKGQGYMQGIFKQYFLTYGDNVTTKRVGGIGSTNK